MTLVAHGFGISPGLGGGASVVVEVGTVELDDISLNVTYAASDFDAIVPAVVLDVTLDQALLVVSLDGDLAVTLDDSPLVVEVD